MSLELIILFQFEIKNEVMLQGGRDGNAGTDVWKSVERSFMCVVVGGGLCGRLRCTIAIHLHSYYNVLCVPADLPLACYMYDAWYTISNFTSQLFLPYEQHPLLCDLK